MKISIVTIAYNSELTIEETILSVLKQDYEDLEYIIVDGGSTDSTLSIINKYRNRVSKLVSEPDNGISSAFNKGIKMASGEWIGIINSDDFLHKNALTSLAAFAKTHTDVDVIYGNTIMFSDADRLSYRFKPSSTLNNFKLYMEVSHPATLVKKSAYDNYYLYDENLRCAMDFELLSRMFIKGAKFSYIDEDLTWFRLGGTSKKRSELTMEESISIAIRNGEAPSVAYNWYKKIYAKERGIDIARKIGIESFLRKIVNKQEHSIDGRRWFELGKVL